MVDFQSREPRTRDDDDEDEPDDVSTETTADAEQEDPPEKTAEEIVETTPSEPSFAYAVVTVTSERSLAEDAQGDAVVEAIEAEGDAVRTRDLIQPSYDGVQSSLTTLAERKDVDAVITIGGTGVEPDDVTIDALERLFEKRLPGFGELFRRLAYDQLGTAVIGTRCTAGIVAGVPIFAVPGSTEGAMLATEEIIIPEAGSIASDAAIQESEVS